MESTNIWLSPANFNLCIHLMFLSITNIRKNDYVFAPCSSADCEGRYTFFSLWGKGIPHFSAIVSKYILCYISIGVSCYCPETDTIAVPRVIINHCDILGLNYQYIYIPECQENKYVSWSLIEKANPLTKFFIRGHHIFVTNLRVFSCSF